MAALPAISITFDVIPAPVVFHLMQGQSERWNQPVAEFASSFPDVVE
jgi:hypothetical protein